VNPVAYIASMTPPLGLAYLASSLREAGHRPVIIDAIGERPEQTVPIDDKLMLRGLTFEEICERIPPESDLIGISGMFSSEWVQIRQLVNLIGDRFPDKTLICGGEHFSAVPELSLKSCSSVDAVVLGEGEETLVELADRLSDGTEWSDVRGLVLRTEHGGFVRTEARPRIRQLDDIPPPAWDLVPLSNYLESGLSYGVNRGPAMPLLASRGCPFQCTFCSNPSMWGTRWLARSPEKVIDEIEEYVGLYQIANVDFCDPTAVVRKDWIMAFCRGLVDRGLNVTWQLPSGTRTEAIDSEVAEWMYRAGCRNLNYAPESGSVSTLKRIKKKVNLDSLSDSLQGAVQAGLNVKLNIVLGFPEDSHADVWRTIGLLVKLSWLGAHDVSAGVFAPYPGSELYDELVAAGQIDHSDAFWNKLAYVDISETVSYCEHISSGGLRAYNWMSFALFYGSNYLFRPQRLVRTVRNVLANKHESRGEMALGACRA